MKTNLILLIHFLFIFISISSSSFVSAMNCHADTNPTQFDILILMDTSRSSCSLRDEFNSQFNDFQSALVNKNQNVRLGLATFGSSVSYPQSLTNNFANVASSLTNVNCSASSLFNGVSALNSVASNSSFWRTGSKRAILYLSDTKSTANNNNNKNSPSTPTSGTSMTTTSNALINNNIRVYFVFNPQGDSFFSDKTLLQIFGNQIYSKDTSDGAIDFNASFNAQTNTGSIQSQLMLGNGCAYASDKSTLNSGTKITQFYGKLVDSFISGGGVSNSSVVSGSSSTSSSSSNGSSDSSMDSGSSSGSSSSGTSNENNSSSHSSSGSNSNSNGILQIQMGIPHQAHPMVLVTILQTVQVVPMTTLMCKVKGMVLVPLLMRMSIPTKIQIKHLMEMPIQTPTQMIPQFQL